MTIPIKGACLYMENLQTIKDYVIKIADFAYAIALDEKTTKAGGIALTMSEAIQDCAAEILRTINES